MKLVDLIANGTISVEDLTNAPEVIEMANLVSEGVKACKKNLLFPMGIDKIECFSYTDMADEYSSWGTVTHDGIFTCWCNWGGNHEIGRVNLNNPIDIMGALSKSEFACDLNRFLNEQIEKANG